MEKEIEKNQENTTFVITETKGQNSREFGKPSDRYKIYFLNAEDLDRQIKELKEKGYLKDE